MADNDNLTQEHQQKEADSSNRFTKNMDAATKKRVMARAKLVDQALEHEDEDAEGE